MKRALRPIIAFGVVSLLAAGSGFSPTAAQEQAPPPPFSPPDEEMLPERARERVELLLKWKIIEVLGLDEEQAMKIFPLYSGLRQARQDYVMARMRKIGELRQTLDAGGEKKNIEPLLSQLDEMDRSFNRDRAGQLEKIKSNLSLEQWARYLIFEAEFPREIRNLMRDRHPLPRGPGGWRE